MRKHHSGFHSTAQKVAGCTHPRVQKQVNVFVEENLILLVSCTKVLQKLMSQFHYFLHSDVFTL